MTDMWKVGMHMETKSPWNEYGEAKIQELEIELKDLTTVVEEQQKAIAKMANILGKFTQIFDNIAKVAEGDDRK